MARTITTKLKEPIKIRFKKLANGSQSIYLDIYKDGKREYEFLKLYLLPELNPRIKAQNATTLAAAEKIKSERIIEITENAAGLKHTSSRSKMLLSDWMQAFYESQQQKGVRTAAYYLRMKVILEQYDNKARMRDINKDFCLGFLNFLRNDYITIHGTDLSPKSIQGYFGFFCTALNGAIRADIISENPISKIPSVDRVKVPESKREYLTVDEIKSLIKTDFRKPIIKQAFLFACYSGLRFSDIKQMTWDDMTLDGEQWRVAVTMQKTTTPIYLPLSKQAVAWMPDRNEAAGSENVFAKLPDNKDTNYYLKQWVEDAGIAKPISFHCSRHTFATLMLTLGADLYTTSKLLGHRNVRTTQIYAKIVNKKKDEAVSLIDKVFGD